MDSLIGFFCLQPDYPEQAPSSSMVSKFKFMRVTFSSGRWGRRRNSSPRWEDWWKRRARSDQGPFR